MTCIVGLIREGTVLMGADSGCLSGWSLIEAAEPKLFRLGEMLIGDSGSVRAGQILRYFVKPASIVGEDLHGYLVRELSEPFRRAMKDCGIETPAKDGQSWGEALIALRGRLFRMESDFAITSAANSAYMAVGGASDIALGAMFSSQGGEPRERIDQALRAAAHHHAPIRCPFIFEELPRCSQTT
jgi:hypothetical protein